jgi:hypothetical protein
VKDVNDENRDNTDNNDTGDDVGNDKNDENSADYDKDVDAKKTSSVKYFTPDTHTKELPIDIDENTAICLVCAKLVDLQGKCVFCQKCFKFVHFFCGNTGKKVGLFKNCTVHTKKIQRYLLFFFFLTPVYYNITPVFNIITPACNIITPACNIIMLVYNIITLTYNIIMPVCNNIMPVL